MNSEQSPKLRTIGQALSDLKKKLDALPPNHPDRTELARMIVNLTEFASK